MIYEKFEKHVISHPDAIAVRMLNQSINYFDLNKRVENIAATIIANGASSGDIIAIYYNRNIDLIASMMAVFKLGLTYLPIDYTYPINRVNFIVKKSKAIMILTDLLKIDEERTSNCKIINTYSAGRRFLKRNHVSSKSNLTDLSYVLFTSGSTGEPKGVCIQYSNTISLLEWAKNFYSFDDLRCVLAGTSVCFDLSIFELLVPLVTGNSIYLVNNILDIVDQGQELKKEITLINTVPSAIEELLRLRAIPESARIINLAGEPLRQVTVNRIYQLSHIEKVFNLYGPTEDTTYSTAYLAKKNANNSMVPIGKAIKGSRAIVLDKNRKLVPLGVKGELYLSGPGLAKGYLYEEEQTNQRFFEHIIPKLGKIRLYRTGDVVYRNSEGELEFVGRADDQIKFRGVRIEPGEIESAIIKISGIDQAVVVVKHNEKSRDILVAYLVVKDGLKKADILKKELSEKLPPQLIPSDYVFLESLPLNENGKIDRKILKEYDISRKKKSQNKEKPSSSVGIRLHEIWAKILGKNDFGVNDSFFSIGGYSLLAAQLLSFIRSTWKIKLSLREIFDNPTITLLEKCINKKLGANQQEQEVLSIGMSTNNKDIVPLTYAQKKMWFLDKFLPDNAIYNLPLVLEFRGDLHIKILKKALLYIINKHHILNVRIFDDANNPKQYFANKPQPLLDYEDLCGADKNILREKIVEFCIYKFNLKEGALIKTKLIRKSKKDYILIINAHHIVMDGRTQLVLCEDLSCAYNSMLSGKNVISNIFGFQYFDYAVYQNTAYFSGLMQKQSKFWLEYLRDMPEKLDLPLDYCRPNALKYTGSTFRSNIKGDFYNKVKAFAHKNNLSLFMLLLAAFQMLMYRFSLQKDVVIGSPLSNRVISDTEDMIGCFVNTLPFRNIFNEKTAFTHILEKVKNDTLNIYDNQLVPFEYIVEKLNVKRCTNIHPIFQVVFVMQDYIDHALKFNRLDVTSIDFEFPFSKFDITLSAIDAEDKINLLFEYSTELFCKKTIIGLSDAYINLLNNAMDNVDGSISALPVCNKAFEKNYIINNLKSVEGGKFSENYGLADIFESNAVKYSKNLAVIHNNKTIDYEHLNRQANKMANYLIKKRVTPGAIIGISMEKSINLLVSILGVLKAGCAYLPLDPYYPADRLCYMANDARLKYIICDSKGGQKLSHLLIDFIDVYKNREDVENCLSVNPKISRSIDDLAYVIYTSGSTGKPKGVMITHNNIIRLFKTTENQFNFNSLDSWCLFHSYSFDFSVWEIWGSLFYGGKLFLVDYLLSRSPEEFYNYLLENKITVLNQTPSAFKQLIKVDRNERRKLSKLRYVIFGGEALDYQSLNLWVKKYGLCQPELINMFGITETTIHTTYHKISNENFSCNSSIIGKPLNDSQIFILDKHGNLLPAGWIGEMYIYGGGVSKGYLYNESLTEKLFLNCPCDNCDNKVIFYKSGDLGRVNVNGDLEYHGRIDNQIQLRGFRVELNEIIKTIREYQDVRDAIVLVDFDKNDNQQLKAYVVGVRDNELNFFLKAKLPNYMLPNYICWLNELPLTINGKVDISALQKIDCIESDDVKNYSNPDNDMEKFILEVWKDVLQSKAIEVTDMFFDVGGHSLLLVQVHEKLRSGLQGKTFLQPLSIVDLFKYPTVRGLSNYLLDSECDQQASGAMDEAEKRAQKRKNRRRDRK